MTNEDDSKDNGLVRVLRHQRQDPASTYVVDQWALRDSNPRPLLVSQTHDRSSRLTSAAQASPVPAVPAFGPGQQGIIRPLAGAAYQLVTCRALTSGFRPGNTDGYVPGYVDVVSASICETRMTSR